MTTTPPAPTGPISRERATEIVLEAISKLKPGTTFVLVEDRTIEKDWGWVFQYGTPEYLETRDVRFLVPGTGPVAVERANGALAFLPTSVPPDVALAEYERRRSAAPAKN